MRGLHNGARPLLGLDKHPDKPGSYVINEKEADDVRKIFRIFLNTGSRAKTIQELEKEGIKPKLSGKYGKLKIHDKWSSNTLGNLLGSAVYIGCHEVNKSNRAKDQNRLKAHQQYKLVKASWPAIVEEEEFYAAQDLLDEAKKLERVRLDGAEEQAKRELTAASPKSIEFIFDTEDIVASALVKHIPFELRSILGNIVNNSIEAMNSTGKIFVRIRDLASEISISVSDNGIGIKPESLPKVFQKHFSEGKSTKPAPFKDCGILSSDPIVT